MDSITVRVKYYNNLPKWKQQEAFTDGTVVKFTYDENKKAWYADNVPLEYALKLHRSEGYDIVDPDDFVPIQFAEKKSPLGKGVRPAPKQEHSPALEDAKFKPEAMPASGKRK